MDRRAAMEMLGLDPNEPVAHDRVRRAYLRKLRVHSPERDPEGFRRLREAFEIAEVYARVHDAMAAFTLRDASGADDIVIVASAGAGAPELRAAPESGGERDRSASPEDASGERDASDVRDADDEPPQGGDAPDEPQAGDADEPPTLGNVTDEILALLERNEVDAALDLRDRWSRSALDDHRTVSPLIAQRWALTRELLEVAVALPSRLRGSLARGIRRDDLSSAEPAFVSVQRAEPRRMDDIATHMAERAPSIYGVFCAGIQSRAQRRESQSPRLGREGWRAIWLLIVLIGAISRATSCGGRDDRPPPTELRLDPGAENRLRGLRERDASPFWSGSADDSDRRRVHDPSRLRFGSPPGSSAPASQP